jgi:uroporphyrinogen decarboxylase
MNARSRFLETLRFGRPDRVPFYDHEIRADVLARWRREGLPADVSAERFFALDRWDILTVHEDPCLNVLPIPEFRGHLRTRADFERLVAAYDPETPGRYPPQWDEMVRGWQSREYPVGITAWRGMLQSLAVVGWKRLEDVMYGVYDHPHLIDETMEHVTHFMLSLIEQGLREVRFDFAILAEPIASWHGPVVGPKTYRRHVLPGLRRVVDRLRGAGIDIIVLQTHGAVKPLIPLALEAGVNTLWIGSARAANLSCEDLRKEFGRDLALIGGLDVRALEKGSRAIEREIMSVVPPLLEQGGYVPMVDERVRSYISFRDYAHYRELIRDLATGR